MLFRNIAYPGAALSALFFSTCLNPSVAQASNTVTAIYHFDGADGRSPSLPIFDNAGNLYGVTGGGAGTANHGFGYGTVYQLVPPAADQSAWTKNTLTTFEGHDDALPNGQLMMDSSGNLYGTGSFVNSNGVGDGYVFELSPPGPGQTTWTETGLHRWKSHYYEYPTGPLVADSNGNLYGVDVWDGSVFELTPPVAGHTVWPAKVLHRFGSLHADAPNPGLVIDQSGALYGTVLAGGEHNKGAVFRLSPPVNGQKNWGAQLIYSFKGYTKGSSPVGPLVADAEGALYGSLANDVGVIFKLTPPAAGHTVWQESIVYKFSYNNNPAGGYGPMGALAFDSTGALYGTTIDGGQNSRGVVFKLTPPPAGTARWSETVLYSAPDGHSVENGVTIDKSDNVYFIQNKDRYADGLLYQISPQ